MNYLEQLNQAQLEAVKHTEGPCMVIAGAGSGKTRVLTYRIVHLIKQGVDPFNILALTFTNKAAREMKARINKVLDEEEGRNIWMGTFHSIFSRILRIEADRLNYPRNFTIYDTQDSRSVLRDVIKSMALDDKIYKVNVVHNRISSAKNNLISPEAYADNSDIIAEDRQAGRPRLGEIYKAYNLKCFRAGSMDFDDLLFNTNVLIKKFPDVLYKYQHKFTYILVDEYQDTNFSQYLIVKQLAAAHLNLCVVGDDAQSIYAFRGADIQNILNFKKDYPEYQLFKLEQNYRSTKTIVNAANAIIENNKDQIRKSVWTDNDEGKAIKIHKAQSDNDEGMYVADRIYEIFQNENPGYDSFVILYRTNAQSRSFEEALRKLNLPYRIYGGLSFYQRKEIKDLIAYFRLSANHNDEESFKRVINYPARGIGKTTLNKLVVAAAENEQSIWDVISNFNTTSVGINKGTQKKLVDFQTMIHSFSAELETKSAFDLGYHIAKHTNILRSLHDDKTPEGVARYENIQELLNALKSFTDQVDTNHPDAVNTLSDFLVDVALLTDADLGSDDDDKISLMTVHAAKGLEFPFVFVVGLEENLFPSQLSVNSRSELEEERRLFYVALTRAMKEATMTYATTRYRWGNLIYCEPSRFLDELGDEFTERSEQAKFGKLDFSNERKSFNTTNTFKPRVAPGFKKVAKQATMEGFNPADSSEIETGMQVMHQRFGKGKVLNIEGVSPNQKATVFFPKIGQKQLLLRFAKLQIL